MRVRARDRSVALAAALALAVLALGSCTGAEAPRTDPSGTSSAAPSAEPTDEPEPATTVALFNRLAPALRAVAEGS